MELRHPNLMRVHEYVRDRDQPYFVMDYFPSVHMRLVVGKPDKYGLPKGRLHGVITQSGSALSYMHEKNWVHRDVKPENIIVSKAGETRLIDYALAMRPFSGLKKLLGAKPKRQGTHSYMSPEQIRCEPPVPSADIYSFGITCYELACGRQPFRANSSQGAARQKHLQREGDPADHPQQAGHRREFNDLVLKMVQQAARPTDSADIDVPSSRDFVPHPDFHRRPGPAGGARRRFLVRQSANGAASELRRGEVR